VSDALQVAVRAFTRAADPAEDESAPGPPEPLRQDWRYPPWLLVLDTETTTDPSQRLLFASYRVIDATWTDSVPSLSCAEEGLVHPDDLATWRPDEYGVLDRYVRTHLADVNPDGPDPQMTLRLRSVTEFLDEVWLPLAYEAQGQVVCFNAPFDLSRIALRASPARAGRRQRGEDGTLPAKLKRSAFEGGWSLSLKGWIGEDGKWHDHPAWGRLRIKHIDSKRALKAFGPAAKKFTNPEDLIYDEDGEAHAFRGHLLDLRTLTFALSDRGHTLESACDAFGVPYTKRKVTHGRITPEYVDYNREDVGATASLWREAMREYVRHPIELQATRAYSPASIGKAYLKAMGVVSPLQRLGATAGDTWDRVLGFAMVAYYGGRSECRIRRCEVPCVLCDFTSMYPTVQTLMGLERLLTCEAIDAIEGGARATERWVRTLTTEKLLSKRTWRKLNAICLVQPRPGDVFPIRARYAGKTSALGIGVSEWEEDAPALWYTLPDVIASFLLSGQVSKIERVIRFEPRGDTDGLQSVKVRGEVDADLRSGRFFASIVETRAAMPKAEQKTGLGLFLKVLANSASYGIFAQMDRHELSGKRTENLAIFGLSSFEKPIKTPEEPGAFFFAPTAALVTGAARLMLALLEVEVSAAGGTYAFADTDSMAIVAARRATTLTIHGAGSNGWVHEQRVRALSWEQVRNIAARFDRLNPYRSGVEHLLKIEDDNFVGNDPEAGGQRELRCFAISAKRYRLRAGSELVSISDASDLDAEGEDADEEDSVVKRSEHGLGHLLSPTDPEDDPRDWIAEAWRWIPAEDLGGDVPDPEWLDLPAVSRTQVSTPGGMKAFAVLNKGMGYAERVKPFNFLLTCYPDQTYGRGEDDEPLRLVAPYERDPDKWIRAAWYDTHTGEKHRITTYGTGSQGAIRVRSYREVLADYRTHEEAKSVGPDGLPCGRKTRGLLGRRRVAVDGWLIHVGKESNSIEARMRGEVTREDDYLNRYEPRLCACGCGGSLRSTRQRYLDVVHKQRAYRRGGPAPLERSI